jgi:hypothetical protein
MFGRTMKLACVALMMVALGCAAPLAAQAQESKTTWRISQPSGNASDFKTQQEALQAVKTLPVPPGVPADLQYFWEAVKTIKSKSVHYGGALSITYWMGLFPPTDPEWSYNALFETEAEAIADFMQTGANPLCPGQSFVPTGPWSDFFPGMEGRVQMRSYLSTTMAGGQYGRLPLCRVPRRI